MVVASLLFLVRLPARVRVAAWVLVGVAGLAAGLALNLQPANLTGSNFLHYYLGAKYPIRYNDFYRMVQAGRGQPQVGMRDLEHPARYVRNSDAQRRAYFIDLLHAHGTPIDPRVGLDSLRREAHRSGAISSEAGAILRDGLAERFQEDFAADVRLAVDPMVGRPLVDDYGYNGSPFYGWIRHADPALHREFDPGMGRLALLWQVIAAILMVAILGRALGFDATTTVASAAMLFASWDFVGYALPGLVFGELWIPVAIAVLAIRKRWPLLAGAAIAWAGLVKLFPFVLLLPSLFRLLRARLDPGHEPEPEPSELLTVLATIAFTILFVSLSSTPDRSWLAFLGKIQTEFHGIRMLNNVSLGSGLQVLGVHPASWLLPLLQVAALVAITPMFFVAPGARNDPATARRALVLVAATGLVAASWQNYYAVLPLVLLPYYARERPRMAALLAACFALSCLLAEFDGPLLKQAPWLHLAKLFPYWAAPVAMIATELRGVEWSPRVRWGVPRLATALLVLAALEVTRVTMVRTREQRGDARMARGDAAGAGDDFRFAARLSPADADLPMAEGEAHAALGDFASARSSFARAVRLRPDDAPLRDNFARLLMMSGAWDEAGVQLDRARTLSPDDPEILGSLARVRTATGRQNEARRLLARARDLAPADPVLAALEARLPPR